eukprot:g304.t1
MDIPLSPFRGSRLPSSNTQKFMAGIKTLCVEVPRGKNKVQLQNLCRIQGHLEKRVVPIDVLVDVFDCICRCINSNNHKICVQALKCGQSLALQAVQQSRISAYLPALTNLVVEQWGDTKEIVRSQALDCACAVARVSIAARFNLFLRTSNSTLWRTRLVSLHFFTKLVDEFGLNIEDKDVLKSISKCGNMLSDKYPEIRRVGLDIIGKYIYSNIGDVIWDKRILGNLKFSKTTSDNLKKHLSTITPNVTASNNLTKDIKHNNNKQMILSKKKKSRKALKTLSIMDTNILNDNLKPTLISPVQKNKKKSKRKNVSSISINVNHQNSTTVERGASANGTVIISPLIPLPINTPEDLVKNITDIEEVIATKSENWKFRNEALSKLQRIIVNDNVREMVAYETQMYRLADAFSVQLTELRSSVVRQVCLTLETFSTNMGAKFGVIGERCVPILLSLTANRIGIISKSADNCLRTIIKSWSGGSVTVLNKIIDATSPKLDRVTRARSQQYLLDALNLWPRKCFKKEYIKLRDAIFQALTDRSDEVRQLARKSFWALVYHFPKVEETVACFLSSSDQERLLAEKIPSLSVVNPEIDAEHITIYSDNESDSVNQVIKQQKINYVKSARNRSFHCKSPVLVKHTTPDIDHESNSEPHSEPHAFINTKAKIGKNQNYTGNANQHINFGMNELDAKRQEQQGGTFRRYVCVDNNKHICNNKSSVGKELFTNAESSVVSEVRESNYNCEPSNNLFKHNAKSYFNRHFQNKNSVNQLSKKTEDGRIIANKEINEKLNKITELLESVVWSSRMKAIDVASDLIDNFIEQEQHQQQNHETQEYQQLHSFMDKICKNVSKKLPDSHHKVTIKILQFLSELLLKDSLASALMKNMHCLLPSLFNTLASKRKDITNYTTKVLSIISANFDKNELARLLCSSVEHRTWESKLSFQDFVYHIIPAASRTFGTTNLLRLMLKKICTNIKIRNAKLQLSCSNVLCAIYKGNPKPFFAQVSLMEHKERHLIIEAMKEKVGDIDEKLKHFVRSSSYTEEQVLTRNQGRHRVKSIESSTIPKCPSSSATGTLISESNGGKIQSSTIKKIYSSVSPGSLNTDFMYSIDNKSRSDNDFRVLNTLGEILIAAMAKSSSSRCDALFSISQICKARHLKWNHVHAQLVNVTLNALQDTEVTVQLHACDTLRCMMKERTKYMYNMIEIVLHRLIHAVECSVLEMQSAFKKTLEIMGKVFKPSVLLKCLLPIVSTLNGTPLQMLLNLVSKILPRLSSGTLLDALADIMPRMLVAVKHEKASIRKEAVFCFVEIYFSVGESVMPYFEQLSIAQRKLITIYKDLLLLKDGAWLNDHIILFFYEYLTYNSKSQNIMHQVCLCHPMNTMLLQYGDMEDLTDMSNSLNFFEKQYIFIPVNNASFGEFSQNGTHWCLLVVDLLSKTFLIYDSMGENSSASNSTNRTIKNLSKIVDPKKEFSITIVAAPKQINGYDCGMYCICFSEMIIDELIKLAKKIHDGNDDRNYNKPLYVDENYIKSICTPQHITLSRKRILKLIEELKLQHQNLCRIDE